MLFASVGSLQMPFVRLINAIENLPEKFKSVLYYQGLVPASFDVSFNNSFIMERNLYESYLLKADLLIIHAGIGSILESIRFKKKAIIIPRKHEYGEHFNDHQLEIFKYLINEKIPNFYMMENPEKLEDAIYQALNLDIDLNENMYGLQLKEQLWKDVMQLWEKN